MTGVQTCALPISLSFVFNLDATYTPTEQTQLGLVASRRNQSSALFLGQNYSITTVGVSGGYRPRTSVSFYTLAAYNHLSYSSTLGAQTTPDRKDDYFGLQLGATIDIALRWALGIFYEFRSNASSLDPFDYSDRQIGMTLSWAY